jgi:predicted MPP superfamily phosphohydrolase
MNEKLQLVIFIGIFVAIYALMNYFVMNNMARLFGINKNVWFYLLLIVLTISYIVASILESSYNNKLTNATYYVSSFWLGFVFLMFCLILLFKLVGVFVPLPGFKSGIVLLALGLFFSIFGIINAQVIAVDKIDVYTDKVSSEVKIVQMSDLHIGPINGKNFLRNIVYMSNKLEPDYVFLTGDLLDGRYKYNKSDFNVLKELAGKKYFITGNHETYAGIDYSMHIIDGLGFTVLRNESVLGEELQIIGIDDAEDKKQVLKTMHGMKLHDDKYKILLYHRPIGYRDVGGKIDLMLSGHTHAGQIFPFSILAWLENKYINGLYNENGTILYVSSGAGTWGPPMRIGSRSEIVFIRLLPTVE